MEGFSQKHPNEMHSFGYGNTAQHYGTGQPGVETLSSTQPFMTQSATGLGETSTGNVIPTPGTSGEFGGDVISPPTSGRKKKKKHKSGDSLPGSSVKPEVMDEESLVSAAIPLLSENQGVEDLLFNASLPSSGGTVIGGQYLLNNTLLDQILTEKKLQLMQSPDVVEWLQKHVNEK